MTLADRLDLTSLAAPQAVETISYDVLLADLVARVVTAFAAKGIDYDVGNLETDPVKIVLEGLSAHEVLVRARVNDAVKAVLAAYAKGGNLDHLVGRTGVLRATGESDAQLLERYLVSLARPSAGALLGYRARVLEAWPGRGDVAILGPATHGRPGDIDIVLAAPEGGAVTPLVIASVQAAASASDAKPLTDVVTVRAATLVPYTVHHRITVAADRNAGPILAAALASASAFVSARYLIGLPILRNAIIASSYVAGVIAVEDLTEGGDIAVAADAIAWCAPGSITLEIAG